MGILIVHRVGEMRPGEPIVLVSAAARHRRAAIQAVDFAMDHLKSDAWFWKREKRAGRWHWIEPRAEDHADLARWT
jgi:molybdopterin synthase catalytic subunit